MTKSQLCEQMTPPSFQDSTRQEKKDLKQAIKDFLFTASNIQPSHQMCPQCGQPMEYRETVFWLYGEDNGFQVRLPVCRCSTKSN